MPIRQLPLIVRYRSLAAARRWRNNLFAALVLAPLIGAGAFLAVERVLTDARGLILQILELPLAGRLAPLETDGILTFAIAVAVSLAIWPACRRELFGSTPLKALNESEAVPATTRFHATCLALLVRAIPISLVLLGFFWILAPYPVAALRLGIWWLDLYAACLGAMSVQLPLTLWQAHIGGRFATLPTAGLAGAFALLVPPFWPIVIPWAGAADRIDAVLSQALALEPRLASHPLDLLSSPWILAATLLLGYGLARRLFVRWQRQDLELGGEKAGPPPGLRTWWASSKGAERILILRDLRLVLRRFSPVVPLATAASLAFLAAAVAVSTDPRMPALWQRRAGVLAATFSVSAALTVVPFLVAYQRPRLWIERSSGVAWDHLWRAKVHTAALVALVPFSAGALILGTVAPGSPGEKIIAILQLVAAAVVVASLTGMATFEMPDQPWVSILFSTLLGLAVAALFIFYPKAWWLWLIFYAYLAGQLAGRAGRRVRLAEMEP